MVREIYQWWQVHKVKSMMETYWEEQVESWMEAGEREDKVEILEHSQ